MKLQMLHTVYRWSLSGKRRAFEAALNNPRAVQERILRGILRRNCRTEYGRKFGFPHMDGVDQYRKQVPVVTYDDLEKYLEPMKMGTPDMLTQEQVLVFEKTSGSAAASKYIPFTSQLLQEIHNGTSVWLHDLYTSKPALRRTAAYWSISSRVEAQERTSGGINVGMADDTEYFSRSERWFMRQVFAVDPRIARIRDSREWKKLTALYLLAAGNLGLISVWSPTFLILMCRYMEEHWDELMAALANCTLSVPAGWKKPVAAFERQHALAAARHGSRVDFKKVWPELQLVSTWADGPSQLFIPELEGLLPGVEIQGKGLLMTEGIISFPMQRLAYPVLAVCSHFYEFLPVGREEQTVLPEEVRTGERYIPVITTGGGLYRYNTGDQVEITGFEKGVPLLRFISRNDRVCDLFGEKLSEAFALSVLEAARARIAVPLSFCMLAPSEGVPGGYTLYIETEGALDEQALAEFVEEGLRENHHYSYCRQIGQLLPVRVERIEKAMDTYERVMVDQYGRQRGAIKFPALDTGTFWSTCFQSHRNLQ